MTAPATIAVERLPEANAEFLGGLLADSEAEGVRFVRRLIDEWRTGANRFAKPGEALFVARCAGTLVGVCGLNIDPFATGGAARVGRVRHLYVRSTHRRRGIGGALVTEVMAAARGTFDRLHLRTTNHAAATLYERLGFRRRLDDEHCTHFTAVHGTSGDGMKITGVIPQLRPIWPRPSVSIPRTWASTRAFAPVPSAFISSWSTRRTHRSTSSRPASISICISRPPTPPAPSSGFAPEAFGW